MKNLAIRINELKATQTNEENNNFANGDLWNNCQDKITNILMYGNENGSTIETVMGDTYAGRVRK